MAPRISERLGRRGAMLTLMGVTYILVGLGTIMRPTPTLPYNFLYVILPNNAQGVIWMISGVIACIFAWRASPTDRPPDNRWAGDGIGWIALYVMPFLRILSYLGAWLGWLITRHGKGELAWYTALLHVPFILIVLICSGWREGYALRVEARS